MSRPIFWTKQEAEEYIGRHGGQLAYTVMEPDLIDHAFLED